MLVGRYYMDRRDYTGAINRFKLVVTRYQTTRHVEEALLRLTEAYLSLGIVGEAQTSAAVLGHNFPDSRWYKDAYALVRAKGLEPSENQGFLDQPGVPRASASSADRRGQAHDDDSRQNHRYHSRPSSVRHPSSDLMLTRLSIRDIVLIDRLDIDFARGPCGAHRRDRRRQVDPARCLCAGARRARRRRAGAPWRGAGPGDGGVRSAARRIRRARCSRTTASRPRTN